MAKQVVKDSEKETKELDLGNEELVKAPEEAKEPGLKYKIKGSSKLNYGSIVYSETGIGGTVQLTNEVVENLIASNAGWKQTFTLWDGSEIK